LVRRWEGRRRREGKGEKGWDGKNVETKVGRRTGGRKARRRKGLERERGKKGGGEREREREREKGEETLLIGKRAGIDFSSAILSQVDFFFFPVLSCLLTN
jgi:hypothetical protein